MVLTSFTWEGELTVSCVSKKNKMIFICLLHIFVQHISMYVVFCFNSPSPWILYCLPTDWHVEAMSEAGSWGFDPGSADFSRLSTSCPSHASWEGDFKTSKKQTDWTGQFPRFLPAVIFRSSTGTCSNYINKSLVQCGHCKRKEGKETE